VLVVEDDLAICDIVSEALRDRGHDVVCAKTDRDAYQRIAEPPLLDGLVLDINLGPGTTGYDVARFARQLLPRIAVVYVSGEVSRGSVDAFGVANSAFMAKPFTPAELADAVTAKLVVAPA